MHSHAVSTLLYCSLSEIVLGATCIERIDVFNSLYWRPNLQIAPPTFNLGTVVDTIYTDSGAYHPPISEFAARKTVPVGIINTSDGLILEFAHTNFLPGRATDDFLIQYRFVYGLYYNYETEFALLYDAPLLFEVQPDGITATHSGFASLQYPGPVLMSGAHPGTSQYTPIPLPNGSHIPFSLSIINTTGHWTDDSFSHDLNYDLVGYYDFSNAIIPEPGLIGYACWCILPFLRRKITPNVLTRQNR